MHVQIARLARRQDGLVTWRQLRQAGLSEQTLLKALAPFEVLHDGVWLIAFTPPTERQRHRAATLSNPGTILADASAAAFYGVRRNPAAFETVVRYGTTGPRKTGRLRIRHSLELDGHWHRVDSVPILKVERVIVDLAARLARGETTKMLRESLRLGLTSVDRLGEARRALAGRRGVGIVGEWLTDYGRLAYSRCRSDAEARAVEVLHAARTASPEVNVKIAGFEADLSWPDRKLIVEIDGPQWHRDARRDAARTRAWIAAGWEVRRVPSDLVFRSPAQFVALVLAPTAAEHASTSR